jgi:hypothetical protein
LAEAEFHRLDNRKLTKAEFLDGLRREPHAFGRSLSESQTVLGLLPGLFDVQVMRARTDAHEGVTSETTEELLCSILLLGRDENDEVFSSCLPHRKDVVEPVADIVST